MTSRPVVENVVESRVLCSSGDAKTMLVDWKRCFACFSFGGWSWTSCFQEI